MKKLLIALSLFSTLASAQMTIEPSVGFMIGGSVNCGDCNIDAKKSGMNIGFKGYMNFDEAFLGVNYQMDIGSSIDDDGDVDYTDTRIGLLAGYRPMPEIKVWATYFLLHSSLIDYPSSAGGEAELEGGSGLGFGFGYQVEKASLNFEYQTINGDQISQSSSNNLDWISSTLIFSVSYPISF